ncbi:MULTISPECIES: LytTR family DNA-binding domain-containing protein [Pseudoalteromonas]|uniref:LytR/AlgR family response regulator transcription factor n=2 Tax=Pseudoalteromonas TaxID=53246 RepID=UPI00029A0933|nr:MULTISPECIES: LytTR family DNA-binding domain-containing protein [Pseudoalteromonas]MCF7515670.1 LytTR family transcriptional regulator [Pseudoalteromonas sp. L7]AUJ72276.1 putative two-component response-regulatory protein YehT [Pseudoalteromonas sp. NC201]MBR8843029.1 LytTR family transcriptional regulator DNA-binding domain-containing protein [Pseudoalteromonas sp. JC3]MCF2828521.1 LytTR family transcriptional regulator [Pseudoalteromonas sp. OF5H-5]MCF2832961.1 LytTR family transcriptio
MKKVTILIPCYLSALGVEMSTKLKEVAVCSQFVYYQTFVDILETIESGEIDCLLIDSSFESDPKKQELIAKKFSSVSTIKITTDTKLSSCTVMSLEGRDKTDTLIENILHTVFSSPQELTSEYMPNQRLIVKDSGHIHVIKVEELAWVGGAGNYVELHLINRQRSILHRDTMSAMEKNLKMFGFSRIHKSSLVNLNAISELKTRDNGDYDVILENGDSLHLSRRYKQNLSSLLQSNIS